MSEDKIIKRLTLRAGYWFYVAATLREHKGEVYFYDEMIERTAGILEARARRLQKHATDREGEK
jgi:hypothetical protein